MRAKYNTDEILYHYQFWYKSLYGKNPHIRKNGSWIYINNSLTARRISDVIKLITYLKNKAVEEKRKKDEKKIVISSITKIEEKRNNSNVWDVKLIDSIPKPKKSSDSSIWKKNIDNDIIDLFFDRLLWNCGNSIYEMKRIIKNFALSGEWIIKCNECNMEDEIRDEIYKEHKIQLREYEYEIYDLKESLKRQRGRSSTHRKMIDKLKTMINKMKEEYKQLENNSVIFSMNLEKTKQKKKR